MPDALVHPIPEQLTAFALGKLAQAEAAEIADHLAECDCEKAVAAAPDDSVVALLRSAPSWAFQKEPTATLDTRVPVELADHSHAAFWINQRKEYPTPTKHAAGLA